MKPHLDLPSPQMPAETGTSGILRSCTLGTQFVGSRSLQFFFSIHRHHQLPLQMADDNNDRAAHLRKMAAARAAYFAQHYPNEAAANSSRPAHLRMMAEGRATYEAALNQAALDATPRRALNEAPAQLPIDAAHASATPPRTFAVDTTPRANSIPQVSAQSNVQRPRVQQSALDAVKQHLAASDDRTEQTGPLNINRAATNNAALARQHDLAHRPKTQEAPAPAWSKQDFILDVQLRSEHDRTRNAVNGNTNNADPDDSSEDQILHRNVGRRRGGGRGGRGRRGGRGGDWSDGGDGTGGKGRAWGSGRGGRSRG